MKRAEAVIKAKQQRFRRALKAEEANIKAVAKTQHEQKKLVAQQVGSTKSHVATKKRLGIVGAGVSGMYVAYLLKYSKYAENFDISILESTGRPGGRILTERFEDADYQYGEFGAMRIPQNHHVVIDLIEHRLKLKLQDFFFSNSEHSLFYVNGKLNTETNKIMTKAYANSNTEKLGYMQITVVSESPYQPLSFPVEPVDFSAIVLNLNATANPTLYNSVASLYDQVYVLLSQQLLDDPDAFYTRYDKYTVYSYFHEEIPKWIARDCIAPIPEPARIEALVESILHYGEMTSTATGLNHLALIESVLDYNHFLEDPNDPLPWKTVEGGMDRFTTTLAASLAGMIRYNRRVTEVRPSQSADAWRTRVRHAHTDSHVADGEDEFDRVVVTAPFGAARLFIPPDSLFSYGKRQAIRSLNYDQSTKVIAQFDTRWWELPPQTQKGGATVTDLPLRQVVYPSFGYGKPGKGVLLCSYTWQNDALLIAGASEASRRQLLIDNLNLLHGTQIQGEIKIRTHVWHEAFALFAPGQFPLMINGMIPEFGVHFAGEHLSVSHAWILGALNSATRAVREILVQENLATIAEAWEQFPDSDFDADTWNNYMGQVNAHQ